MFICGSMAVYGVILGQGKPHVKRLFVYVIPFGRKRKY